MELIHEMLVQVLRNQMVELAAMQEVLKRGNTRGLYPPEFQETAKLRLKQTQELLSRER